MNIVLIGYRGSGKSAVGKMLAARLQRGFVDTDDLIEERHRTSINEIVKSEGWDRFRSMEKKIIEEITREDNLVIAVGGGAVLDADNVKVLRRNGFMIWLKADFRILLKRIGTDPLTIGKRPSLTGKGSLEEIEEVLTFRNPYYEEASEIQLDTSGLDVDAVVEWILSFVSLSPSGRGRK